MSLAALRERAAAQDAARRTVYDAEHGAGAWDRAMAEIRSGPTMIAFTRPCDRLGYYEYGR